MNLLNDFEVASLAAEIGIFEYPNAAGFAAGVLAEQAIGILGPGPTAVAIGTVLLHPSAVLTASNSNYTTISINKRTAGGAGVLIASMSTQLSGTGVGSGNWVAWTTVPFTVVAGAFISPGDVVTFTAAATGSGVTVPQFYLGGFTSIK
jgi:hypothetical protein